MLAALRRFRGGSEPRPSRVGATDNEIALSITIFVLITLDDGIGSQGFNARLTGPNTLAAEAWI